MDRDFFIATYNAICKTIWGLLIITTIIGGYLIQRSFEFSSIIEEKIVNLDESSFGDPITLGKAIGIQIRDTQTESLGLKINYATLALLWPIILVSFFHVISYALKKRIEVVSELKVQFPDFKVSNLRLNLVSIAFNKKREQNSFMFIFLFLVPTVALLFHSYSGINIIHTIFNSLQNHKGPIDKSSISVTNQLLTLFYAQVIISMLCMIVIWIVNIKSSRNYKISTNMVLSINTFL